MDWLKPEILVSAIIGVLTAVCTVGGTLLVNWTNSNVHSALSDATMSQLVSRLDRIETSVSGVPLYVQRLTQLETWRDSQIGYNGSTDSRLSKVERDQGVMQSKLDDIRSASGAKLR